MKKMLLATALASSEYRMCSTRRLLFKTTGSSSTEAKSITHHFFVSGIGQIETVDAAKICGGAENVVKTEPSKHSNGLLGFITRHLYRRKRVCIAHNNCMSCPSIWATLSALLINILLLLPVVFGIASASLRVNNPAPKCTRQPGRLTSTPEAVVASRTD